MKILYGINTNLLKLSKLQCGNTNVNKSTASTLFNTLVMQSDSVMYLHGFKVSFHRVSLTWIEMFNSVKSSQRISPTDQSENGSNEGEQIVQFDAT